MYRARCDDSRVYFILLFVGLCCDVKKVLNTNSSGPDIFFSLACMKHSQTVIQPCMWFMEEPSQFSVGQTAEPNLFHHGETNHIQGWMTVWDCFRKRMSVLDSGGEWWEATSNPVRTGARNSFRLRFLWLSYFQIYPWARGKWRCGKQRHLGSTLLKDPV